MPSIIPDDFHGTVTYNTSSSAPKIGLISLSTDKVIEEVVADVVLPAGARVFTNRIVFNNPMTLENLALMEGDLDRCLGNILPGEDLDVVAFACSSGTVAIGEAQLENKIRAIKPAAKVTNPVTAAVAAFQAFGIQRISILTPYSKTVNASLVDFFEQRGIEVQSIVGFDTETDSLVTGISDQSIFEGARQARHPNADGLFLSCTALRAAHLADALEAEFALPIVTSNQAMCWHILRLAGLANQVPGFGRLLTLPAAA